MTDVAIDRQPLDKRIIKSRPVTSIIWYDNCSDDNLPPPLISSSRAQIFLSVHRDTHPGLPRQICQEKIGISFYNCSQIGIDVVRSLWLHVVDMVNHEKTCQSVITKMSLDSIYSSIYVSYNRTSDDVYIPYYLVIKNYIRKFLHIND